jgi:acyl-CoA synthetase (NDP forming)
MNASLPLDRSLESLLRPQSVAIVGASDNVNKIGGRPLRYLLEQGFAGKLYPITQRGDVVQGVPSYTSLDDLPEAPDCVILSVPATAALEQVRACVRVGAQSAVLFSSGFAEMGAEGLRAQAELVATAAAGGMRLLGPNTIGSANFARGAVLSFASIYQDFPPLDGPVAIVSQSGAVGVSTYALLRDNGIGVRYVCTTGNQSDVDTGEFLAAVLEDPEVGVVLMYLEEVRNRTALSATLASARKRGVPVLVLASARSASGARMADCHTGSLGMRDNTLAELFADHGCRIVESLPELSTSIPLYLSEARAHAALPRIGVISNSGASCVLSADVCDALGLPLAELGPATRETLDALLPPFSRSRNPVDLTAMLLADSALLGRSVAAVMRDPGCDALVLSLLAVAGAGYDVPRFAADTAQALRDNAKPLVFCCPDSRVRAAFSAQGIAVFSSERDAIAALKAHAVHRAALRSGVAA